MQFSFQNYRQALRPHKPLIGWGSSLSRRVPARVRPGKPGTNPKRQRPSLVPELAEARLAAHAGADR